MSYFPPAAVISNFLELNRYLADLIKLNNDPSILKVSECCWVEHLCRGSTAKVKTCQTRKPSAMSLKFNENMIW